MILTEVTKVHPCASVAVTVLVPPGRPVTLWVVSPFDQKYEYGGVPPVGSSTAEPPENPKHKTLPVTVVMPENGKGKSVTVTGLGGVA